MRTRLMGLAVVGLVLTGCATGSASSAPAAVTASVSAPATAAVTAEPATSASASGSAIVGEWVGTHDCERIITMLGEAGLDEFAAEQVYGNELVPGVTTPEQIKNPAKPCDGAVPREHSHFFTADGAFGSKDFRGQQVDDGTYTIEGDDVVVINGKRFTFAIDGDALSLEPEPVDISTCTTKECRFGAAWVLMVAMPGTTWTRGEITGS